MLDHRQTESRQDDSEDSYALVVIGAGIAGLNALNAAVEYLPKGSKVLLLDEKHAPGGMWNTAYDYVRLHQPHPMFTVGNMQWDWRKPRDYLAARDEVQSHLGRALAVISEQVALTTAFGTKATRCEEVATARGPMAEVAYQPIEAPDQERTVHADRAIHASGLNYTLAEPLRLSSNKVVSIIPQALRATLSANPKAPVYVVGGGKTGMDTILASLSADPSRKITLIKGRGTHFLNRTKYLPTGLKRWTSGELVSRFFRDMALNFDGENEGHTIAHFRMNYSTDPEGQDGVFLYGLQSEEEHARIKSGLSETHTDYLTDVVDGTHGPQIMLRSGATINIDEGSIIVNCSGSFFRGEQLEDPVPVVSPSGCVMAINPRSGFHFLSSVAGFFGAHLLYRDLLRGQGFYALDHEALFRQNRNAWVGASAAQAYMNQVLAVQALPLMLLDRCGLDLDRWYPLPRRMAGLLRMKSTASTDIAHCKLVLDKVSDRFGIKAEVI